MVWAAQREINANMKSLPVFIKTLDRDGFYLVRVRQDISAAEREKIKVLFIEYGLAAVIVAGDVEITNLERIV